MKIINEIVFEKELNGKLLRFHVPAGSSYQECYDVLVEFMKQILDMSKPKDQPESQPEVQQSPEA